MINMTAYPDKADFSDDYPWDESGSGPDNRDSKQLWAESNERAFEAGKTACEDGKTIDGNPHTDLSVASTRRNSMWWERGWKAADFARATRQQLDGQHATPVREFGFDPDSLVAGNVIVMWDGHEFGMYADLPAAVRDAKARITEQNCHTPPDDFKCLEFLEVLDEDAGCLRDLTDSPCRNEHGTRISFNYPVKELGNQIEKFCPTA